MNLSEYYGGNPEPVIKKTLNYLSDLANNTGHNISHWNLDEIFVSDGKLIGSPTEINKRFFERIKIEAVVSDPKLTSLSVEDAEKIAVFDRKVLAHQRATFDDKISTELGRIKELCGSIMQRQAIVKEYRDKKSSLKVVTSTWVNDVLSLGFFTLHEVGPEYDPYILFTTRPVVLSQKRADGVELRVPFGVYTVKVLPLSSSIFLNKGKDNVTIGGYWHPFVSDRGIICWGTAQQAVSDMIGNGQWFEVMRLLASLLTTYPGTTPYRSLDDFYFHGVDKAGLRPWLDPKLAPKPFCRYCEELEIDQEFHCENEVNHNSECGDCGAEYRPGELALRGRRHRCDIECEQCGANYPDGDDHECEDENG